MQSTLLVPKGHAMRRAMPSWVLIIIASILGAAIAWLDSRPNWDDAGITAGLIFLVTVTLGALVPRWAWRWALAVGVWIPAIEIARDGNPGALMALGIAFVGAYVGSFIGKAMGRGSDPSSR